MRFIVEPRVSRLWKWKLLRGSPFSPFRPTPFLAHTKLFAVCNCEGIESTCTRREEGWGESHDVHPMRLPGPLRTRPGNSSPDSARRGGSESTAVYAENTSGSYKSRHPSTPTLLCIAVLWEHVCRPGFYFMSSCCCYLHFFSMKNSINSIFLAHGFFFHWNYFELFLIVLTHCDIFLASFDFSTTFLIACNEFFTDNLNINYH